MGFFPGKSISEEIDTSKRFGYGHTMAVVVIQDQKQLYYLDDCLATLRNQCLRPLIGIVDMTVLVPMMDDIIIVTPSGSTRSFSDALNYFLDLAKKMPGIEYITYFPISHRFHESAFWIFEEAMNITEYEGGIYSPLSIKVRGDLQRSPVAYSEPIIPIKIVKAKGLKFDVIDPSKTIAKFFHEYAKTLPWVLRLDEYLVALDEPICSGQGVILPLSRCMLEPYDLDTIDSPRTIQGENIVILGDNDFNGGGWRLKRAIEQNSQYRVEVISRFAPRYVKTGAIMETESNRDRIVSLLERADYYLFTSGKYLYRPFGIHLKPETPRGLWHSSENAVLLRSYLKNIHRYFDHVFIYDRSHQVFPDAILVHTPLDTLELASCNHNFFKKKLTIGHSPSVSGHAWFKGTIDLMDAVTEMKQSGRDDFEVDIISDTARELCIARKRRVDIFFDQICKYAGTKMRDTGWFPGPGISALESALLGSVVITENEGEYPMITVDSKDTLKKKLIYLLDNRDVLQEKARIMNEYVRKHHSFKNSASEFLGAMRQC